MVERHETPLDPRGYCRIVFQDQSFKNNAYPLKYSLVSLFMILVEPLLIDLIWKNSYRKIVISTQ